MKKLLAATAVASALVAGSAQAETNYMVGVTWSMGGNNMETGISARVLFSDGANDFGLGGGVTYYMQSGAIGYDAIAAYMTNNVAIGGGYDFTTYAPVFSLGYFQ